MTISSHSRNNNSKITNIEGTHPNIRTQLVEHRLMNGLDKRNRTTMIRNASVIPLTFSLCLAATPAKQIKNSSFLRFPVSSRLTA